VMSPRDLIADRPETRDPLRLAALRGAREALR
jgi:hypothetical protein